MLWICLNVFSEELLLQGCLDSIRAAAPEAKIVAVDGCYKTWVEAARRVAAWHLDQGHETLADQVLQYTSPKSLDRTLEILRANRVDKIIESETPWEHEFVKRSQYFVGGFGDWYLILDGDERLQGKIGCLDKLDQLAYNIMLARDNGQTPYPVLRLFRHYPGMQYRGAHHALFMGDKLWKKEIAVSVGGRAFHQICSTPYKEKLSGEPFWIQHLHEERGKDSIRNFVRGEYYRFLTSREEHEFRLVHGL